MATRMQQRRGTAAQWTAANPVLAAGEIGFETDTSKFKMGNGSSNWAALTYFANAAELTNIIDGAPELLDTLNELAAAIGDDPDFINTVAQGLTTHSNTSEMVHGIEDTSLLATQSDVNNAISDASTALGDHAQLTANVHGILDTTVLATQSDVNNAISDASTALGDHAQLTENVHGIVDTTVLVTQQELTDAVSGATVDQSLLAGDGLSWDSVDEEFDVDTTIIATRTYADEEVSTHNDNTSNVHGIADTANLATKSYADTAEADAITAAGTAADTKISTAVAALTKSSVGLDNVDNTSDSDKPISNATQDALDLKADLAGAVFTGNVEVDGNLVVDGDFTVNGTNFNASATSIVIEDNIVQLAHSNAANTVDLGLVVAYNDGSGKHAGIVRDVSDAKWKLFKDVASEPTTVVAFGEGSLDALAVGALEATTVTPSSGVVFSDGTQTKEGVPSRTPIIQKTAGYTLSTLTHRDSLIEMGSGSAITLSIPTDETLNYPIGTTIDILQTGAGQVTIAAVTPGTTTVNATPGLKLRTTWSSCTLMKRAANTWVVYGDLTA
jgi:hypothetical protein